MLASFSAMGKSTCNVRAEILRSNQCSSASIGSRDIATANIASDGQQRGQRLRAERFFAPTPLRMTFAGLTLCEETGKKAYKAQLFWSVYPLIFFFFFWRVEIVRRCLKF